MADRNLDLWGLDAAMRPIAEARGLPNAAYVDPAFYRAEGQSLFGRTWTCVGVGAEIPQPGDRIPVTVAGQPLFLVRDKEAKVRAFHNVCSHRGTKLVTGPGCSPVVLCPYHSWSYALDGRLVRTPEIGGPGVHRTESFDRTRHGLKPVRTDLWHDFIFVDLSGEAPPLEECLRALDGHWGAYDFASLVHGGTLEFELQANWKLALENFLESYHLPWVHPALNTYSPLSDHEYRVFDERIFGAITHRYRAKEGEDGETLLPSFSGLSAEQTRSGEYPMVFPNLLLGVQRDHIFGVVVEPLGPDRTRERMHLYFLPDEADATADLQARRLAFREKLLSDWKEVFAEDVGIVERMQLGRASDAFDGGCLTLYHDVCTHRFMRLVADALRTGTGEAGRA